jgi:hypothetical protein
VKIPSIAAKLSKCTDVFGQVFTVSLDNKLFFAGMVVEAAIIGLLFYRRVWRILPVFCIYVISGLLSDIGNYWGQRHFAGVSAHGYLIEYIATMSADSALQIGVLIELAWSILRPLRPSLSRRALPLVVLVIFAVGAAIWPFANVHGLEKYPPAWSNLVHLLQTASVLRILFFMLLAGCSQLLSIGWRDRELQVATGLGFYSLVSLAIAMWRTHRGMSSEYAILNQIGETAYLCSLLYWAFSFAQKEAERREFTPQMQSFLLAVAGSARTTRVALSNTGHVKSRRRDE